MRVVLASASPRRRELLTSLIDEFDVVPSDVPEEFEGSAVADATRLAAEKARRVAAWKPDAVVVAADTIVFDPTQLYGKPNNAAEARQMLHDLRGRDHQVVTGLAVAAGSTVLAGASIARVTLAPLTDDQVEAYIASGVPLDKAGAYAIQHEEFLVVAGLEGCYCNVVGLPLWRLREMLVRAGVDCRRPDQTYARCASCPERPGAGQGAHRPTAP